MMNNLRESISKLIRRRGFSLSQFELASHPRAPALLITGAALVMFATGNVVATMAQAQATPAASSTSTPAPNQKPEATPTPTTGTIKGRIVAADGQPLINANVLAQSMTIPPTAKPTRVDFDGRFVFDDLQAASYIIYATAPGYIDEATSLGDASQWPRHLLGSNVRITMIRGGVITGLVTNAKGEPIVGVPVHATLTNGAPSMTSFFTGAGNSETDDRGSYRIYGLLPGQYIVNAGGNSQFGQFTASGFDMDVATYYPSATRDTAVPVSVRSGDETAGIDIRYKGAEGHSISGTLLGMIEASAPVGGITIFLAPAGSSSLLALELASAQDPRRGFSFNGVADGDYDLFASFLASQTDGALVGTRRVTVRGGDVTGVELHLAPLAFIKGIVTLDPIKAEDKCDKRGSQVIEVTPGLSRDEPKKMGSQTMISMLAGGLGAQNQKGEFALRNLEAARYRLEIKLPTESWYVRAINLPGAAARAPQPTGNSALPVAANANLNNWQGVVTVKSGEQIKDVSIMVGQDAAGMSGRLETDGAAIREGTRVHLVPVDREQANNILRYSETVVKSDGRLSLTNIAPGRYFILPRIEPASEPGITARPVAWDPIARAKLRREAEAANIIVELKPCQRVVDYRLKLGAAVQ
jgi:hypothetical protein